MTRAASVLAALCLALAATHARSEAPQSRRLLAGQRSGIILNDKDQAAVQRKADKDAALKFKEAIKKFSAHPHKSGWAAFQQKSDKEKKEWEAKRLAASGEEGSNKRKSGHLGYKTFTSQSTETQQKWHALNQRALSKGHIDKLPGVADQPYRGKEYRKTEGKGLTVHKTDKNGVPLP